jgi:tryptophan 2,3-dioxygenase
LWFLLGAGTAFALSTLFSRASAQRASAVATAAAKPASCPHKATESAPQQTAPARASGCPFPHGGGATPARTAAAPTSGNTSASEATAVAMAAAAAAVGGAGSMVRPRRGKDPVHYHSYLQLDKVLNAQLPKSLEVGGAMAHDEMLFIIVHQAHELWFKQIIHDINSIRAIMSAPTVAERSMGKVLERLTRVHKIQRLLIDTLPVLETMTPLSFLEFREYLFPASGFQSMQFRKFEVLLGLRRKTRSCYAGAQYDCVLTEGQTDEIRALESEPSLFELLDRWLARMPLLRTDDGFDFGAQYQAAVTQMFDEERDDLQKQAAAGIITDATAAARNRDMETQRAFFARFFDAECYQAGTASGAHRLSYSACQAALLINFYQEEPLLQVPYQLLSLLVDIDENLSAWRAKHAAMVHRMLGVKMGTGGSSGYSYLLETVNQHRVFSELANIASLMVPRAYLPPLPESVRATADFSLALKRAASEASASDASASDGPH